MKLYFGISYPCLKNRDNEVLFCTRTGLTFDGTSPPFKVIDYGFNRLLGQASIGDRLVKVFEKIGEEPRINKIRSGDVWVEDENGIKDTSNDLAVSILAQNLIVNGPFLGKSRLFAKIDSYSEDGSPVLASCDASLNNTRAKKIKKRGYGVPVAYDGDLYISNGVINGALEKFDSNLELKWQHKGEDSSGQVRQCVNPLFVEDLVIFHARMDRRREGDGFISEIVALNKITGLVAWKHVFPTHVDDHIILDRHKLAVFSGGDINVLETRSGRLSSTISTAIEPRPTPLRALECLVFYHRSFLFIVNAVQRVVGVFSTGSMECVREIELPISCTRLATKPVLIDNNIFFELQTSSFVSHLFIVDIDNVDAPFVAEEQPNFKIIEPKNAGGEVHIVANDIGIDDLIRFGESSVLGQMSEFGKSFWNEQPDPDFNGVVKLIYQPDPNESRSCNKMLDIMVERVNYFASDKGYKCGKGKTPATLTYLLE